MDETLNGPWHLVEAGCGTYGVVDDNGKQVVHLHTDEAGRVIGPIHNIAKAMLIVQAPAMVARLAEEAESRK